MRPVNLPTGTDAASLQTALRQIEQASQEDAMVIADDYTVTLPATLQRTFNPGTATLADVANVLATFLWDLQHRGSNRGES